MLDYTNDSKDFRTGDNRTVSRRFYLEISNEPGGTAPSVALHWDVPDHSTAMLQAENESALNTVWNLPDIDSLKMTGYPYISLPEGLLNLKTSLRVLTIEKCVHLKDISEIAALTNLETLTISQCDGLDSLPPGVGCLEKLRKLRLCLCNNLQKLPEEMGLLSNLRTLEIDTCPSLRSLPIEISKLRQLELLELEYFDIFSAANTSKIDDFRTDQNRRKQIIADCSGLVDYCCPPAPLARDDVQDFLESSFPMILRGSQQIIPPELKHFHPKQLRLCGFQKDAILQFFGSRWDGHGTPETISLYRCTLGNEYFKVFPGLPKSLVALELHGLLDDLGGFVNARLPSGLRRLSVDYNPPFPSDEDDQMCLHYLLEEYPLLSQISCQAHRNLLTAASKYQMLLNRCGRVLLRNSSKKLPLGLWPTVLERVRGAVKDHSDCEFHNNAMEADVIYWLLRGPALLSRPQGCASPVVTTRKRKVNIVSRP
mmetsp:Transcript_12062/g.19022  ORF Transcript_12062/g.19022 Transcript_12062/m.19022 type:complete len:483 (+) Transcript_12062:91-1539(+)